MDGVLINKPPWFCSQMHWPICRKAKADLSFLGHLIVHLAPRDFILFHGCYLWSLVTTTQGLPQPGPLSCFIEDSGPNSLLLITVTHWLEEKLFSRYLGKTFPWKHAWNPLVSSPKHKMLIHPSFLPPFHPSLFPSFLPYLPVSSLPSFFASFLPSN